MSRLPQKGDKVLCVDTGKIGNFFPILSVQKGKIYTIEACVHTGREMAFNLEGVPVGAPIARRFVRAGSLAVALLCSETEDV